MPDDRLMTDEELMFSEQDAKHDLEVWVRAFLDFPTTENQKGVEARMIRYRDKWMNGRKRPTGYRIGR